MGVKNSLIEDDDANYSMVYATFGYSRLVGCSDYYVSSMGVVYHRVRSSGIFKVVKGFLSSRGYITVRVCGKSLLVHRLVYEHFGGGCYGQVYHIDGDKLNNHIDNLGGR